MNMDTSSENHSLQKYYLIGQEKVKTYMAGRLQFILLWHLIEF